MAAVTVNFGSGYVNGSMTDQNGWLDTGTPASIASGKVVSPTTGDNFEYQPTVLATLPSDCDFDMDVVATMADPASSQVEMWVACWRQDFSQYAGILVGADDGAFAGTIMQVTAETVTSAVQDTIVNVTPSVATTYTLKRRRNVVRCYVAGRLAATYTDPSPLELGVLNLGIAFSVQLGEPAAGVWKISSITVTEVPPSSTGTLLALGLI